MTSDAEWLRSLDTATGLVDFSRCSLIASRLERLEREREVALDGNKPVSIDRETLGRFVREAWVRWAEKQPNPKPNWLIPYDDLAEPDKEADRQIGEAVARWTLIHDAASFTQLDAPASNDSAADAKREDG